MCVRFFLSGILALLVSLPAVAQHAIDVQQKAVAGEYYEALLLYDKMAKRRATVDATIAAGKSAWALGLADRAILEIDSVLRTSTLPAEKRARLLLSRGVIEFQEQRYQNAILFVEKTMELLPNASALRGKAWVLWGESLYALGSYGIAEKKYEHALTESADALKADVHYLLGRCQMELARFSEAKVHFESLPVTHSRTPDALRYLATIALNSGAFEDAEFWLVRGREHFPDHFIDSWVDYALARVAMHKNDSERVSEIYEEAATKFPPSDHWLNLLAAANESYHWNRRARHSGEVRK